MKDFKLVSDKESQAIITGKDEDIATYYLMRISQKIGCKIYKFKNFNRSGYCYIMEDEALKDFNCELKMLFFVKNLVHIALLVMTSILLLGIFFEEKAGWLKIVIFYSTFLYIEYAIAKKTRTLQKNLKIIHGKS